MTNSRQKSSGSSRGRGSAAAPRGSAAPRELSDGSCSKLRQQSHAVEHEPRNLGLYRRISLQLQRRSQTRITFTKTLLLSMQILCRMMLMLCGGTLCRMWDLTLKNHMLPVVIPQHSHFCCHFHSRSRRRRGKRKLTPPKATMRTSLC